MRKLAFAAALSALVTSFVAPAVEASPPTPGPRGRLCSYSASSDPAPDSNDDAMTGQVNGGPLVWDRNYWLHCHIQVDNNTHTGPVAPGGDVHGPSDPHDGGSAEDEVAVVASQVLYESPEDSQDYLCTSVSWPTSTGPNWLYWHPADDKGTVDPSDDEAGHWSPSNIKPCSRATQVSTGPVIDAINDVIITTVDPIACGFIDDASNTEDPNGTQASYIDDEGDVFVDDGGGITEARWRETMQWDCPPYVDFEPDPWAPGDDGTDGGEVIDNDAPQPVTVHSAVVGYVTITMSPGDAAPSFQLHGELAAPNLWNCFASAWGAGPYTVTCNPVGPPVLRWECNVLHADITTGNVGAKGRTAMHCDGDAAPEARTRTAVDVDHDSKWAGSAVVLTQFRCTIDDGSGAAPVPRFVAGCGDPGAARVE